MNEPNDVHPKIHDALNLDGDPEKVRRYYREWADQYDADVAQEGYSAPAIAVDLLGRYADRSENPVNLNKPQPDILDAGCGTGLVGRLLYDRGYRHIDGCDLSAAMVKKAAAMGVYRALVADVDLNQPLTDYAADQYDVVFCVGVFTLGHVLPNTLAHLAAITRPHGLLITSTRAGYYNTSDYQGKTDELVDQGVLRVSETIWDAPYTRDGDAHYWVYHVR